MDYFCQYMRMTSKFKLVRAFTPTGRLDISELLESLFTKSLYLVRIGRPDILWSVNKLARSETKWTQACDRRLAMLISLKHHTNDFRQYLHVGNTAQHCRLGLFQDSDFAGDLEDSKSTSEGVVSIFGRRTFFPISWMCKKQTSISHSCAGMDVQIENDGLAREHWWRALRRLMCRDVTTYPLAELVNVVLVLWLASHECDPECRGGH